jgi:hypothetical protein
LRHEVIGGGAPTAVQIDVVETLAVNGQDATLAEGIPSRLIEVQNTIEQYRQVIIDAHGPRSRQAQLASMNRATRGQKGGKSTCLLIVGNQRAELRAC